VDVLILDAHQQQVVQHDVDQPIVVTVQLTVVLLLLAVLLVVEFYQVEYVSHANAN
jgi:hypothetical protein